MHRFLLLSRYYCDPVEFHHELHACSSVLRLLLEFHSLILLTLSAAFPYEFHLVCGEGGESGEDVEGEEVEDGKEAEGGEERRCYSDYYYG